MRQPGDIYLDPKDGIYRKVIKLGPVLGVEVMHGYTPPETQPVKKKKPPPPSWKPRPPDPLAIHPEVEKFILWRYPPFVRPTAKGLTQARLDRYIRMALVGKQTNWFGDWRGEWAKIARDGVTNEELMAIVVNEFGCSRQRNSQDKRRVCVDFWRKGKKAWFAVGAATDPDKIELTGLNLLGAVRRAMKINPLSRAEAADMRAFIASFTFKKP